MSATDGERAGTSSPGGRRFREWPTGLVLAAAVASLVWVAAGSFRQGSVALAAAIVLALFLRLFLRDDEAGMLAVRTKTFDVLVLLVLGVGLALLAFLVPAPPA